MIGWNVQLPVWMEFGICPVEKEGVKTFNTSWTSIAITFLIVWLLLDQAYKLKILKLQDVLKAQPYNSKQLKLILGCNMSWCLRYSNRFLMNTFINSLLLSMSICMFVHRQILKVLSVYHNDAKMMMVGLRALALLLKSGKTSGCFSMMLFTQPL